MGSSFFRSRIAMTEPTAPAADLDRLAELLGSDASPEHVMDISTLDGFIAAALAGPDQPELADVLPWMLDPERTDEQVSFGSEAEAQELVTLIAQHWRDTADILADSPEDYEPVLYLEGSDDGDDDAAEQGEGVSIIDDWCFGFVLGLQLQDEVFERLPDDLKDLLGPVFLYGSEEGRAELERLQLTPEQHESIAQALPGIVVALYRHFRGDGEHIESLDN
jgi:uncharacterized protein